ncbi:hypothetical protein MAUB1S_09663 [Mycolicibacterium aubagnense]
MTDPRKPVLSVATEHRQDVLDAVHRTLLAATSVGAKEIGATGASFVIIGIGVWAQELTELDGRATAKLFRAMADILDPRTNEHQKRRAEKDRAQAVRDIYSAIDLDMTEVRGNG